MIPRVQQAAFCFTDFYVKVLFPERLKYIWVVYLFIEKVEWCSCEFKTNTRLSDSDIF